MRTFSPSCFPSYLVRWGLKPNRWRGKFCGGMVAWPLEQFESPDLHSGLRCFPKGVFVPDLPSFQEDPSRTFGMWLSTMGFMCMGLWSLTGWEGLSEPLDVHLREKSGGISHGNLRHIDVEPITDMAKYVTGYGMKGLKRPSFPRIKILVLPKTLGELPDRKPCDRKFVPRHSRDPLLVVGPFPG